MFGAFSGLASLSKLTGTHDDDWIDRLNHLWTVVLLTVFTVVVSSAQYVGDPIHCWCPAQFTSAYVSYTKAYCWIKNTYFIPMDNAIPTDLEQRTQREITYYQWVPIIFLFMALLFKFPNLCWRLLNTGGGVNMEKIVSLAESTQLGSADDRDSTIKQIAVYLDRWLRAHREYHYNVVVRVRQRLSGLCFFCLGKRDGTYLTGFYVFVKLLYCLNVVGQFFLLNAFLSMDYNMYGFQVIQQLIAGEEWGESARFPRITLCDFDIRQLQNVQRFTVQCVLPINLFNEKIFIFLWFWLFFVATLTFLNFAKWLYSVMCRSNRARYVKKYLKMSDGLRTAKDSKLCRKFADDFLRDDGVFVLRVVGKNSTELVVKDLVRELWRLFKRDPLHHHSARPTTEEEPAEEREEEEEDIKTPMP